MRVFLMNFSSFVLQDVASELKKHSVDICYWQGYRKHFEELTQDTARFPNTIFHTINDAMRNIPPHGVDINEHESISDDIFNKLHDSDYLAIAMVGRKDYEEVSFSQKKHIYYNYAQFWYGMLKRYKPDAVLFSSVPHSCLSYTLYALSKILGVKTLFIDYTRVADSTRAFIIENLRNGSQDISKHVDENKDKKYAIADLSDDVREYHLWQSNPKIDSTPDYMHKNMAELHKPPVRFPQFSSAYNHMKRGTFLVVARSYVKMLFSTWKQVSVNKDLKGYQMKVLINKWVKRNKSLLKEYVSLQSLPDLSENYIYVPLQVQPEATTTPHGDIFEDQLLMLQFLSRSVPDDWIIYVKENPAQLSHWNIFSHLYRYPGYYEEIASMRNVKLVPMDISTFDLIENSQVVATVTGTAAWEAALRSKPALVFGYPWYMHCEGIFKVSDVSSCVRALRIIQDGYVVGAQQVINYLKAIDDCTFRAKDFRSLHFPKNPAVSYDENVTNLSRGFLQAMKSG